MVNPAVIQNSDDLIMWTPGICGWRRVKKMVDNWATVVHLLTRLGFISIWISVIAKMEIPVIIIISRLITITVSQEGMILRTARLTKAETNKSLSAMGSR